MSTKVFSASTDSTDLQEISADLVASVVQRVPASESLSVKPVRSAGNGDIVLVRVKQVNPWYSVLETADGSERPLREGELILGVLGTRKALRGFSGHPPAALHSGMPLHLLNRGGVIGECSAFRRDWGWPTEVEYVGTVVSNEQPVNLQDHALRLCDGTLPDVPVVLVLGTCMEAGKTSVCKQLLKLFAEKGFSINAGKAAGVGSRRDVMAMKDHGAKEILSFLDFGLASTAHLETISPVARSMVHYLSESEPDFIILEMGDGILGGYHIPSLLEDEDFMSRCISMLLCANDLMGVWGALQWLSAKGLKKYPLLVSGPVTDSAEGIRYIEEHWNLPAGNAFDSTGKICTFILESLMPWLELE